MNGEGEDDTWLTGWEQQCADSIEEQPDYEQSLSLESDNSHRKIWTVFQDSATSIAQLYRDRYTSDPGALWVSFQTAAGTVTSLYKEGCDGVRRSSDIAKQCGYQKRNRELLNWAKRKRTLIRREDLLAYLSGKPPPTRHNSHHRLSPRPRSTLSPPPATPLYHHLHHHHQSAGDIAPGDASLTTFREALSRGRVLNLNLGHHEDLCTFIAGEMQRHGAVKRPASPATDVAMGSPTGGAERGGASSPAHHHQHIKRPRYM